MYIEEITRDEESQSFRVDVRRDDGKIHVIGLPYQAVASWAELLGYTDYIDAIDAIVFTRVHKTEPPADPKTGECVWTELYLVKEHLERTREAEAATQMAGQQARVAFTESRSIGDFDGQRQALKTMRQCGDALYATCPRQWSREKAQEELYRISGGECPENETLLAKCQKRSRDILSIPDPDQEPTVQNRTMALTYDAEPHIADNRTKSNCLGPVCRQKVRDVLEEPTDPGSPDCEDKLIHHIQRCRGRFLHGVTGWAEDPLGADYAEPKSEAEVEPRPECVEDVIRRHQEAS